MINQLKEILFFRKRYLFIVSVCLFICSFVLQGLVTNQYSPEFVSKQVEKKIHEKEQDFNILLSDTSFLKQLNCKRGNNFLYQYFYKPYGIFVYILNKDSSLQLKAWSNNKFNFNPTVKYATDASYVESYENGTFEIVQKKVFTQQQGFLVVAVIPIKWQYFITNRYLTPKFDGLGQYYKYYQLQKEVNAFPIKNNEGKILAYLTKTHQGTILYYSWIIILTRLFALAAFFIFLNNFCVDVVKKINFKTGFSILLVVVLFLRLINYFKFDFPFNFKKLSLFDPSVYASNVLHPSLGDLLLNLILIFWLVSFYKNHYQQKKDAGIVNSSIRISILSFLSFGLVSVLKSLVVDSKISFNVSNFFSLNIYTGVAIISICLLFINFFKIGELLLYPIKYKAKNYLYYFTIIILNSIVCNNYFLNFSTNYHWLCISIIVWICLFVLFQKNAFEKDRYFAERNIALSLKWILYFTLSASFLIIYFTKNLELQQWKKVAENVHLQSDATVENLLNIATAGFSNAFFVFNMDRFKSESESNFLRDSLVAENFSGYLNKYNTQIYLFDSLHMPIYNVDSLQYKTLNDYIKKAIQVIPDKNLFSYQNNNQTKIYFFKKELYSINNKTISSLFVVFQEKKENNNSVFPVLFKQWQYDDVLTNYAYAIYNSGELVNQDGNYNFNLKYKNTGEKYQEINEKDKSILIYEPQNSKAIILVKSNRDVLDFITFFAYLFFAFLLVTFIFIFINKIVGSKFSLKLFIHSIQFNIRTQIRVVIIFVSLFSFLIIGIVTILFFIEKFNQASQDRLVKSVNNISTEIANLYNANNNYLKAKHDVELLGFAKQLGVDINLFDSTGSLIFTTQPYIYNKKLIDSRMNPIAYQKIFFENQSLFKQNEKISELSYISLYKPLINNQGRIIACINIPFLNAESELENEISTFMLTLMNLNAFIFLIAAAIAYYIANRITSSFKLISNKMKEVNWQEQSEEIVWNKNDEIGDLVNEYNVMVRKLNATAAAFALSQKEVAWKEMAQQVAHEIKNPLTPMKLSLQYLQKSIEQGDPNIKELSKNVSNTLIEQIDQLSKIAQDFSQFANISNSKFEKLQLTEIIDNIIQLFEVDKKIVFNHLQLPKDIFIINDKLQIQRLFTNIIKNAIEAENKHEQIIIDIDYAINDNEVIIEISDNGIGITDNIARKMFTPNFTTKTSGTGLGLAICKGIVENSNGKIWFKTSEKGTTFYVQLPML